MSVNRGEAASRPTTQTPGPQQHKPPPDDGRAHPPPRHCGTAQPYTKGWNSSVLGSLRDRVHQALDYAIFFSSDSKYSSPGKKREKLYGPHPGPYADGGQAIREDIN